MKELLGDVFEHLDILCDLEYNTEPDMCNFLHITDAVKILRKHIEYSKKLIIIHCDVDMDGLSSGYVLYKFLEAIGIKDRVVLTINKDKEHGVNDKHVTYTNENGVSLFVIVDSSSNNLQQITNMGCDVLVVDHHELEHKTLKGQTRKGEYVIITNMILNNDTEKLTVELGDRVEEFPVSEYIKDERMSGCEVLYELLRVYQAIYRTPDILKKGLLYQWVGISIFTDVISCDNPRNQYYVSKTVRQVNLEETLKILTTTMNSYQVGLDKSFINFSLAPMFNKAIRAGAGFEALDILINRPAAILEMDKYKSIQEKAVANILEGCVIKNGYSIKDISATNISKNYCGVMAARILEETKNNAAVYKKNEESGLIEGSFRGKNKGVNYRKFFNQFDAGVEAQGHAGAFGFKMKEELIEKVMIGINEIDNNNQRRFFITAGNIPVELQGVYHINNMDYFRKEQWLLKLGIINSRVSSNEIIEIMVRHNERLDYETKGKLYLYNILGLECKAFQELKSPWIRIYVEFNNMLNIYARNLD